MRSGFSAALLVVALAGLGLFFLIGRPSRPNPSASTTSEQQVSEEDSLKPVRNAGPKPNPTNPVEIAATVSKPEPPATPSALPPPGVSGQLFYGGPEAKPVTLAPETVLENTRSAIRNYGSMFGENPVGTNPEITQALNGDNPKQVKFLDPEFGLRINSKGELVDPWGTPFFFHQLSAHETEIRSAGPDRQMWTADDLVIK